MRLFLPSSLSRRLLVAALVIFALYHVDAAKPAGSSRGGKGSKSSSAEVINPMRSDVLILNPKNFKTTFSKSLEKLPGAVLFYHANADATTFVRETWNPLSSQLYGIAKIGAVSCTEHQNLCKQQFDSLLLPPEPDQKQTIVIYPTLPASPYVYKGKLEVAKLSSTLVKLTQPARIEVMTADSDTQAETFFHQSAAIPKVVLFTDKGKVAPLYHALAHSLNDRMHFAAVVNVSSSLKELLPKRFHIRSLPSVIIKQKDTSLSLKGVSVYKGEFNYRELHEWLNVHSETFVKGGGFSSPNEPEEEDLRAKRPWLFEAVPQLTRQSQQDLCLKKSRGFCAIVLAAPEGNNLTESTIADLVKLRQTLRDTPGVPELHWSWLNVGTETNFARFFQLYDAETKELRFSEDGTAKSAFVLLNPHSKKLKFTILRSEATPEAISGLIERVVSGDGRFTLVKGNKLPSFLSAAVEKRKPEDLASTPSPKSGRNEL